MAIGKVNGGKVEVVLTLSVKEAQILYNILERVGGSPSKSGRKFSDEIYYTLQELSIGGYYNCTKDDTVSGGILFKDDKEVLQ